jgi:hypothetical protein
MNVVSAGGMDMFSESMKALFSYVNKNDLMKQWFDTFESFSYNNPFYNIISLHVILGQLLKDIKIYKGSSREDARASQFYMQEASSGKSRPLDFLVSVAKQLGLNVISNFTKVSDTYLGGSYSETEDEEGRKKLKIFYGKLNDVDLIYWDEGETLFYQTEFSKFTLNLFDTALNPLGSVSNEVRIGLKAGLQEGEIVYNPHCSLSITSYEPENLKRMLVRKGFFQRIFFYPREMSLDLRLLNARKDAELVGSKVDWEEISMHIANELHNIRDTAKSHSEIVIKFEHVVPYINQFMEKFFNTVRDAPEDTQRIMGEFISRYQSKIYTLAIHKMFLDERTEINKDDIIYAFHIINDMFEKQLIFLEQMFPSKRYKEIMLWVRVIREAYSELIEKSSEDGCIKKSSLINALEKKWGISQPSVYDRLNKVEEYYPIFQTVKTRGREKYIRVI